jgi:hypothetical protein
MAKIESLEADYLVVGAGAMGLAFVDELLRRDPSATFILVDKRAKPGGHWNDAYPFVSLHQPAAFYGVNSMKLGSGGAALASGVEVLSYFDRALTKLLSTGRVRHFGMCQYEGNRRFRSIVALDRAYEVNVLRKTVDASYMNVQVPSTTPPKYEVAPDASLVPLNDLVRVKEPYAGYVIVGAGKTGIDAILFLLQQGVDAKHITWIMSNDSWLMERTSIQPRATLQWFLEHMRVIGSSNTLDDVYAGLESRNIFFRLDESVKPTKFRCATVNREELEQLRRIDSIVRMGRIRRIEPEQIVLDDGTVPTSPATLHVDCTADPLAKRPVVPVFDGTHLTLQSVSMCQQVYSASLIAYVESRYDDDRVMNLCARPVPHPEHSRDYIPALARSLANGEIWAKKFGRWIRSSRLSYFAHETLSTTVWAAIQAARLQRPCFEKMRLIFEQEFPGETFPVEENELADWPT